MKVSLQYSTMIVKNIEESVRFYRDVLGFSEGYHVDFPVGGITIMKSPDGACVELIESPHYPVGLYSIGTDVDNLDEALERLKSKGCEPIGEVTLTSVGRQVFIMDPNGVRICLIEHDENYKKLYLNNNK